MYSIGEGERSPRYAIDHFVQGQVDARVQQGTAGWYHSGDIECLVHISRLTDPQFTTIPRRVLIQAPLARFEPSLEEIKQIVKTHMQHASTIFKPLAESQPVFLDQLKEFVRLALETAQETNSKKTLIMSANTTGNHFYTVAINTEGEILYVNSLSMPAGMFEEIQRELQPVFREFNKNISAKSVTDIRQINGSDCGPITANVCSAIQTDESLLSERQLTLVRKRVDDFSEEGMGKHIRSKHAQQLKENFDYTPSLNYGNPSLVQAMMRHDLRSCTESRRAILIKDYKEDREKFIFTFGSNACKVTEAELDAIDIGILPERPRQPAPEQEPVMARVPAAVPTTQPPPQLIQDVSVSIITDEESLLILEFIELKEGQQLQIDKALPKRIREAEKSKGLSRFSVPFHGDRALAFKHGLNAAKNPHDYLALINHQLSQYPDEPIPENEPRAFPEDIRRHITPGEVNQLERQSAHTLRGVGGYCDLLKHLKSEFYKKHFFSEIHQSSERPFTL